MARFRVNSPAVIHQTFESEVVIVNLETGDYFSLRGSGTEIWEGVVRGALQEEIVAGLAGRGRDEIGDGVRDLFGELLREGLIVPVDAGDAGSLGGGIPVADWAMEQRRPYERPILEKFTDMRELLLLDPIHELDEMGWPKPAGEETAGER